MFIKSYQVCDQQSNARNEFHLSINTRLCATAQPFQGPHIYQQALSAASSKVSSYSNV